VPNDISPAELSLRDRFEKALRSDDGPMMLAEITVTEPTTLLVMAEAYRQEGRRLAREATGEAPRKAQDLLRWPTPLSEREAQSIQAPYEVAVFLLTMIWMAVRGHAEAGEILQERREMPLIPPVPSDWWQYRESVYRDMGIEFNDGPRVVHLADYRLH
jgi:hypothetical protein